VSLTIALSPAPICLSTLDDGTCTGSWGFPFARLPFQYHMGPNWAPRDALHGYAGTAVHITMPCAGLWKGRRIYPLGTQATI